MKDREALLFLLVVATSGRVLNAQPVPNGIVGSVRGLDVVLGGINTNFGPTANIQFVSEFVNLSGSYSFHSMFSDETISESKENEPPAPGTPLVDSHSMEAGVQLNLISWDDEFEEYRYGFTREGERRPGQIYRVDTVYYSIDQIPARFFIGIRGGIYRWNSAISSEDKDDINDPLRAADGTPLGGTAAWGYLPTFTNMTVTTFYAGLAYANYFYQGQLYVTYYADIFFSSKTHFDPVQWGTYSYDIEAPGSRGFPVRSTGFRIGADAFVDWISARAEVGIRPGTGGGYLLAGAGVAFPYWWF